MLAVTIGVWAYYIIENDKKHFYFYLVVILACLFHTSAVSLLLLLVIKKLNPSKKTVLLSLVISFLLPFLLDTSLIVDYIANKIPMLNRFDEYIGDSNKSVFSLNRLLLNILYIFVVQNHVNNNNRLCYNTVIIGIIIMNLFPTSSVIARVSMYFSFFQAVLLGRIYTLAKGIDRIAILLYGIVVFAFYLATNNGGVVPYKLGI